MTPKAQTYRISERVQLKISLHNRANRTVLRDEKRIVSDREEGPDSRWEVRIVQITEGGLVLDLPRDFCSQGERIGIEITTWGLGFGNEINASFVGKVIHLHLATRNLDRESAELEFIQFDKEIWGTLRTALSKQQLDVTRAFLALKGEEP